MNKLDDATEKIQKAFSTDTIDNKIERTQQLLDVFQIVGENPVPEFMHPFRNTVLYFHSRLEVMLEVMIGFKLTLPYKLKLTAQDREEIELKTFSIISPMSFTRKLELAAKMEVLKGNSEVYQSSMSLQQGI